MRRRKRIIVVVLVLLPFLILGGGLLGIYTNQSSITRKALDLVNEQFEGELTISDSYISLFATFPYISVDLRGLRFFEDKAKTNKPLYEAEDVYLGFNVFDILLGSYDVKNIKIKNGHLDLVQYENGDINLLLAKNVKADTAASDASSEAFEFNLSQFTLEGFDLSFFDQASGLETLSRVEKLKSTFSVVSDQVYLEMESSLILTVLQDGVPTFFNNKHLELDWKTDYDRNEEKITISPSKLSLEASRFSLEGMVDIDDDFNLDLKLYGEKPDFNIFAAFAPQEVAEALQKYKNEGQIYFLGTISGKSANGYTPAVAVEFGCENAYFVNTSVEKRVDDLRFSGFFTNGKDRNLKSSELRLQNFYAKPEQGVFQGRLVIRNFEDPYIKINLHADLDMEFMSQFFEIEGLQKFQGQIILDMDLDELVDLDLPGQSMAQLKAGIDSELTLKNLSFFIPEYPFPVTNANGHAVMENGRVTLDQLQFSIGDSDFVFKGSLSDFPAVFHGSDKDVTLDLTNKSSTVSIPQLLAFDSTLMASTDEIISDLQFKLSLHSNARELTNFKYLPKGTFKVEDFYAKLSNYPHTFHDFDVLLRILENDISIENFTGEIDGSDFHFSGLISNYTKWLHPVKTGTSSFDFNLDSKHLKVKDLLSYKGENYLPDDYRDEELKDLRLKGHLDLHYDSVFRSADLQLHHLEGKLNIHPLKLEDFKGNIHFEDGNTLVENFGGRLGKSDFEINMAYFAGKDSLLRSRPNSFALKANALDLDALMNYEARTSGEPVVHADTFNIFELPFSDMHFSAKIGQMNYHNYWLEDLTAELRTTKNHYLYVDTLSLRTADGSMGMDGYFNGSDPEHIYFHSTMKADRLDIDKLMVKFDNFGQDFMINENLHGKVSGTITSKFLVHPDLTPIIEKSEAHMDLTVYQGSLVNFTPLQAMSSYFKDKNLNMVRFDTLQNTFDVRDGMLLIPSMTVNSSLGFIELSGKQGLDLSMDYFIRVPLGMVTQVGFRSLFGGRNKNEIDPDQEDEIVYRDEDKKVRFVNIRVKGTPEDYQFSLGKDKN
ncbi:AsmA-like C-terminal region [Cyclobacterium lianum]|uniref:AsmA-like C-terminal region n=1 Tax=Cyclobacterium lianum TaxID=388280 RepID=A0A1M7NZQ2_9BACT|nr:AsmA-like C-terminal region-containing protein [Cyclobacterium lianum]SHN09621.1 AsmA-like C-terminal region [Cyclobacterium lianum]